MPSDGVTLLHRLFDEVARRYPDRVAVDVPPGTGRPVRQSVTYAELQRQADAIAAALAGVARRDGIVAILLGRNTPHVYAAQIGALKAGAAFTAIDPAFPDDHLCRVLEDAAPAALITDAQGRARVRSLGSNGLPIIDPRAVRSRSVSVNGHPDDPAALAYVVYTSGTTGEPKGVMIEHQGIANLVASDVDYFALGCDERVAQCSSPAYDSSLEESWLAFSVGATLVPLDHDTVRLGPDLVPWLRAERISVFCPPPTLLRSMHCADPRAELPHLRLVYVGGEALPADLADAWSAGLWLENGYGPTECSVTVVRGRVRPGEAVTIGWPVRGHRALVLGESFDEVPDGEPGELCLAGPGLARGYRGREELTARKFPNHPVHGRIFRTGDLARRNGGGALEYLGRIDGQVKLRGYRIELGAVEAYLCACPGVAAAACRVQSFGTREVLAAHVVPENPQAPPATEALRAALRRVLPDYMVPSLFGLLGNLPTTVGGKLDRKALPDILSPEGNGQKTVVEPRTAEERAVAGAFARALHHDGAISIHDDFFLNLGGDSLAAVATICELRSSDPDSGESAGSAATVRDLYETRTVAALAGRLSTRRNRSGPRLPPREPGPRPEGRAHLSTAIQALWLGAKVIAGGGVLGLLVFKLLPWALPRFGLLPVVLALPLVSLAAVLVRLLLGVALTVLTKRLLIGRYTPVRTPVWGGFYTRHWVVVSAAQLIPWRWIEGTVLLPAVLRALGAQVGRRVYIHRGVDLQRGGWDLLSVGDDVTLAQDAGVRLVEFEDGQFIAGPIRIGDGATLDVRAGVSPHTTVERGGFLSPLSWLPAGGRIGENECWSGVPAALAGQAPPRPDGVRGASLPPASLAALALASRLAALLVAWSPLAAVAVFVSALDADLTSKVGAWLERPTVTGGGLLVVTIAASVLVVARLAAQAMAMRLVGPVRPGVVSQWSLESQRIWTKTGLVESAGRWLSGGLFWPWWLRLAGMRIGRNCEISTIIDVLPETVSIDDESFFADGIYFCAPWRHRGTVTVARTSLNRRTFLGNHAVVPAGHAWPAGMFIGVATVADIGLVREESAWFGLPPMELPRREVVAADRHVTHEPGPLRYATRFLWESLRFGLPVVPLVVAWWWHWLLASVAPHVSQGAFLFALAPAVTLAAAAALAASVVVLKWFLIGRVRPGQHPLWSCWCSRWDFLYVAWNQWGRAILAQFEGTLLLNGFLRLMGMRIGRRVVLGPGFAQVVDPDMLAFEDGATVSCDFQAHTFEDRILKIDRVHVGRNATVGSHTVVFYGADIGDDTFVAAHGIVMKRDWLEPGTRYAGSPTRAVE